MECQLLSVARPHDYNKDAGPSAACQAFHNDEIDLMPFFLSKTPLYRIWRTLAEPIKLHVHNRFVRKHRGLNYLVFYS